MLGLTVISVLQIGYVPALVETRAIMLRKDGYNVVSAVGNDQGINLAPSRPFDVVVVGFSERHPVRAQMVRWLKQHLPSVPVVALAAHDYEAFPDADCVTLSEDPRVWLAAVADCVKKA